MSFRRHTPSSLRVVQRSRIIEVRDVDHALSVLRDEAPDLSEEERARLAEELAAGSAFLVREDVPPELDPFDPSQLPPLDPTEPDDPLPPLDPSEDETTWISLQVVDEDGEPLSVFSARLRDPAGVEHEAELDGGGQAKFTDLTSDGTCSLVLHVNAEQPG